MNDQVQRWYEEECRKHGATPFTSKSFAEFCLGYKGSDFEEGIRKIGIYAPYIPLMTTPPCYKVKYNKPNSIKIPKKFWKLYAKSKINSNYYGKTTFMKYEHDGKYWDRKVEEIMNRFDFVQTYRIMEALEWEWCNQGIPSVDAQRETARELLEHIVNNRFNKINGRLGTGGFMAEIDAETGFLGLSFIAVEWEVDDECE